MASAISSEPVHHIALTLSDQLPALQVVIPFVAAPLVVFIGARALAWPIAFLASLASLFISVLLLQSVINGSEISYHMGGWPPPPLALNTEWTQLMHLSYF